MMTHMYAKFDIHDYRARLGCAKLPRADRRPHSGARRGDGDRRGATSVEMADRRKLQAEIDKTLRKVDEQQEVFQQVFDRLHECDQSLKEKYEVLLLIHATTRFFSPELERTTVLSRCAR